MVASLSNFSAFAKTKSNIDINPKAKPNLSILVKKIKRITKKGTRLSIVLHGMGDEKPLVNVSSELLMPSASINKLFTAYAALGILGPSYTFKTRVFLNPAKLKDGVLDGPLIVKGYGDPFLVSERLWLFVQLIAARSGIKKVLGGIVLDQSYYLDRPNFLLKQGLRKPYQALVTPLGFNFNSIGFGVFPKFNATQSSDPFTVSVYPPHPNILVTHYLKPTKGRRSLEVEEKLAGRHYLVKGRANLSKASYVYKPIKSPSKFFGDAFVHMMKQAGIEVQGPIVERKSKVPVEKNSKLATITFSSPPLSRLISLMNLYSNNYMADLLVYGLGQQDGAASYELGLKRMLAWLARQGVRLGKARLDIGSGLSKINTIQAKTVSELLRLAWRDASRGIELFGSLPSNNLEGTLRGRDLPFKYIRMKSGHLDGVCNLAGVVHKSGKAYALVVLAHSNKDASIQSDIDDLVHEFVSYLP